MIIGCGRVGSSVAKQLAGEGWDVTCVDEDENALARLGDWSGGFVVGHGMDADVLEEAGATDADAAVVSTDGDNSNIVIGQILQRRYGIGCVVVRVLDPRRAEFYAERGLRTVCPTQTAISTLTDVVRACEAPGAAGDHLMYVIVAGGGKVGANITRSLVEMAARGDAHRAAARPLRAARGRVRPSASSATRPRSPCSSGPASRGRPRSCSP